MRFLHTVKTAFRPPIRFTQSCWRFFQIPVKEVQKCRFNSNTIKQKQKIDLACSRVFGQDILSCKIYESFEEHFLEVFSIRASLKNWSEWRGTFQTPPSHLFLWDLISWLSRSAHIFYQFPALVLSTTSSPSLAFFYRQRQQSGIFCTLTKKWDKAGVFGTPSWETCLWSDHYVRGKCLSFPIWPLLTHFIFLLLVSFLASGWAFIEFKKWWKTDFVNNFSRCVSTTAFSHFERGGQLQKAADISSHGWVEK